METLINIQQSIKDFSLYTGINTEKYLAIIEDRVSHNLEVNTEGFKSLLDLVRKYNNTYFKLARYQTINTSRDSIFNRLLEDSDSDINHIASYVLYLDTAKQDSSSQILAIFNRLNKSISPAKSLIPDLEKVRQGFNSKTLECWDNKVGIQHEFDIILSSLQTYPITVYRSFESAITELLELHTKYHNLEDSFYKKLLEDSGIEEAFNTIVENTIKEI